MNIMMDADALYPKSFHPTVKFMLPDVTDKAPYLNRADTQPGEVKYYFIDYGLSVIYTELGGTNFVSGAVGHDKSLPESKISKPYDAFKADVYLLGNVYRQDLLQVCFIIISALAF